MQRNCWRRPTWFMQFRHSFVNETSRRGRQQEYSALLSRICQSFFEDSLWGFQSSAWCECSMHLTRTCESWCSRSQVRAAEARSELRSEKRPKLGYRHDSSQGASGLAVPFENPRKAPNCLNSHDSRRSPVIVRTRRSRAPATAYRYSTLLSV